MLIIRHYEQIQINNTPFLLVNVKIVANFLGKPDVLVILHLSAP